METEVVQLDVQRPGTEKISLQAKLIDLNADVCRLTIAWPVGSAERHFDADDFYECLRAFRRVIEPEGFRVLCQGSRPICQGSRPNVRPSGMASQMGGAWKSYIHTLGQPTSMKDLVGTFDPVEDIASVGTVGEQDEFMRRHLDALRKREPGR
jgi:hypothetical protein